MMNDYDPNDYRSAAPSVSSGVAVSSAGFMTRVYALMSAGLAVTGLIAFLVVTSPSLLKVLITRPILFIGLIVVEVGLVIFLTAAIKKMSSATATAGFIAYAVLNGVTISLILVQYTALSVASTFFICAGSFAMLSVFGAVTGKDLSGLGNFCLIGLFGLIIVMVVNMFLQNPLVYYVIGVIGVLIFAGLTAYDTQKIKMIGRMDMDGETSRKSAVMGALVLYLDFINLFLFLLRLFGNRR